MIGAKGDTGILLVEACFYLPNEVESGLARVWGVGGRGCFLDGPGPSEVDGLRGAHYNYAIKDSVGRVKEGMVGVVLI